MSRMLCVASGQGKREKRGGALTNVTSSEATHYLQVQTLNNNLCSYCVTTQLLSSAEGFGEYLYPVKCSVEYVYRSVRVGRGCHEGGVFWIVVGKEH